MGHHKPMLLFVLLSLADLVLTWWLGAFAIVFGVGLIVLAFRLRSLRRA